jgi:hypothetical protein
MAALLLEDLTQMAECDYQASTVQLEMTGATANESVSSSTIWFEQFGKGG